jgi:hypothetical protein
MTFAAAASAHHRRRPKGTPQLWKFGQDVKHPSQFQAIAPLMRSRAAQFDGFCFQVPGVNPISNSSLSLSACRAGFSGMAATDFGDIKYAPMMYWFGFEEAASGDWTNNSLWAMRAQNMANFVQAAYEEECSLIMFDNEVYWDGVNGAFPYAWPESIPSLSLADARAQVRARGEQCMDAVRAVVPNVTMVLLHPLGISSPEYTGYLDPTPFNNVSGAHELNSSFHAGFAYSASKPGSSATTIDGNEVYTIRGVEEFQNLCHWTKYVGRIIDDSTAPIATVRPFRHIAGATLWDFDIRAEFDGNLPPGVAGCQTPAEMKQLIIDSMRAVETYTVFYSESAWSGDWWSAPGTLPPSDGFAGSITQAALDAVAEAKIIGRGGHPVGTH